MHRRSVVAWLALGAVLAACAPAAPTTQAPTGQAPAASPTVARTATPAVVASPTAAAATSPTPAPATAVRLRLIPDASEARFRAQEQLVGRNLPNEAIGATRQVSGTVEIQPNGQVNPANSRIVVDMRNLTSDDSRRDNFIRQNTLSVAQFPESQLVIQRIEGLPTPLPTSGEATVRIVGDLTVRGVTRSTTWETTARFTPTEISGAARTRVRMTDFGMTPPRVGPVLSIEDELGLEIDFRAARS